MRNLLLLFLALPLFAVSQSKTNQKILETEQRRFEAMTRKDTVALRDLLADERARALREAADEARARVP